MSLRRVLFSWLWAGLAGLSISVPSLQAQPPAYRPGELLVRFKSEQRSAASGRFERQAGIRIKGTLARDRIVHLSLPPDLSVQKAMELYAQDPDVAFAEPNYIIQTQTLPDDPLFTTQWGLDNTGQQVGGYVGTPGADLDALHAWTMSQGDNQVIVAVVDTGVNYSHLDLTANLWNNPGEIPANGIDDDHNGYVDDTHGWDFVDDDNQPQDASGHGTHVAGIIAARGDNGIGMAGVTWEAAIMPLRFINAFNTGSTSDAIKAITYAVSQGARVINCSWGGSGYSASLKYIMQTSDALFVCAAGNDTADIDSMGFYPAGFSLANIVSVAASDQMDRLAWFSNYGSQKVHVAAPGIRIYNLASPRQTLWEETFESGSLDGWTFGGDPLDWDLAEAPAYGSTISLANSPDSVYAADSNTWAVSPSLDLSESSGCILEFRLSGNSEPSADYLHMEVSTDLSTWHTRPLMVSRTLYGGGVSGAFSYWTPVKADLGPWDGSTQLYVRFRFVSDSSRSAAGFYIDNLQLTAAAPGEAYTVMQGTSMAAAFVSGVAALAYAREPQLSVADLKTCILGSVDLTPELKDFTATGGRVNAYNALTLLRDLSLSAVPEAADRIALAWSTPTALDARVVIERRNEDQTDFEAVAQVNADQSSYSDSTLDPGTTYYYRVQAATTDGRNGYSPQIEATTPNQNSGDGGGSSSSGGGCFIGSINTDP
jgi:subtilisin family serine protease